MSDDLLYSPGVLKYAKEAAKLLAQRKEVLARTKKYKFDTLTFHGLYSVEEARKMADIPPQLIRLCVGAEDPADIIADLDQALNSL